MQKVFRNNGLSIVLFALFLIFWGGQSVAGHLRYNEEQAQHGEPTVSFSEYLGTGAFLEATAENWESEFLQMAAYVVFTVFLYQKGSSESKDPEKAEEEVDRDPRVARDKPGTPWPVRQGGLALKLYENSLSLALLLLFLISFALHAIGGASEYSAEELSHGRQAVTAIQYLGTAQFWFESLQNWQSEFMSIGVMVVLSIFLRQKGSPESKPVDSAHGETGD